MKTIYLSGPMENIPGMNEPLFATAEKYFIDRGCEVINPVRLAQSLNNTWSTIGKFPTYSDYLANDLFTISNMSVDTLVLLPRWYTSRGCRIEVAYASIANIHIIEWAPDNYVDDFRFSENQRQKNAHIAWLMTLINEGKQHFNFSLAAEIAKTENRIKDYSILIEREQTNKN